ncbi:MAG: topoisomerase IV, partial [Clostridia bacterium]|nr:topoisomerase IV [Clostridia bacterium]
MARKSKASEKAALIPVKPAAITPQPITETIEKNYMPYVMTVIISRAIPEIDGFKPSHRKLLYTMYKMGLLSGARTKSANVAGATMQYHPHGDASIYETMVRLTRDHEALLHPFVDSKGSFGKHYSRDMAYAAPRYTEVRLDPFCQELFRGIDRDAVDMVPNYDNTKTEPTLFPTTFPNVLVTPNVGIAVGMASNICSFNLAEICDGTIALLNDPKIALNDFMDIVKAPDFSTGASIIYNRTELKEIYRTGRGSFSVRARYAFDKKENCIDILQIPYSTSIEAIVKRIADLVKEGKLKEITDFRDEIDKDGFKLTLDLRRGTNPDLLMQKLYKLTPLEEEFACNFILLIGSQPSQLGVFEILNEWIKFRLNCVTRELTYDLGKKRDKLHLLLGLGKILLDIDRAIAIVRGTENDADVIPNLMRGFGIDELQAEYIAEIKLRNLNREYIINRISEIEALQKEI